MFWLLHHSPNRLHMICILFDPEPYAFLYVLLHSSNVCQLCFGPNPVAITRSMSSDTRSLVKTISVWLSLSLGSSLSAENVHWSGDLNLRVKHSLYYIFVSSIHVRNMTVGRQLANHLVALSGVLAGRPVKPCYLV